MSAMDVYARAAGSILDCGGDIKRCYCFGQKLVITNDHQYGLTINVKLLRMGYLCRSQISER